MTAGDSAGGSERTVIVGYEGGSTGQDALAFASRWSRSSGDTIVVVTVHPGAAAHGVGRVDAEWAAYERVEAEGLLEQARTALSAEAKAEFRRVDSGSAAHGLHDAVDAADRAGPLMLVLGSQRSRGLRRTFPGSTAERLLQGSPAPVAMVPWGYADTPDRPFTRLAVAYVATADGRAAFEHAVRMAAHLSAQLTVLSVVPDTRTIPGLGEPRLFGTGQRELYQQAVDEVVASAPAALEVRGKLLAGPVVDALTELTLDDYDLLVCGSRGYGPVRRVLLGGVSSRVVRHSKIPVVVAPRGG